MALCSIHSDRGSDGTLKCMPLRRGLVRRQLPIPRSGKPGRKHSGAKFHEATLLVSPYYLDIRFGSNPVDLLGVTEVAVRSNIVAQDQAYRLDMIAIALTLQYRPTAITARR
jgi:hypothetical protein